MRRLLVLVFAAVFAVGVLAIGVSAEEPIEPTAAAGGGAIEGTVTDEVTGLPVEGAGVAAYWYCPVQRALIPVTLFLKWTDADGRYRLGGLDDNTYYVAFHGEYAGYESEWYDDWREFDDITLYMMTSIDIVGGATVADIDAALTPIAPTPPPASGTFLDDDGHLFEADIEWLAGESITQGCNPPTNDMFCPDSHVTRGQMAAFLVRGLGLTDQLDDPFVDDDDSIFEADIEKLAAAGITKGCNPSEGNTKFCPNDKVTRGQMAAFLVRALGYVDDGGGDLFVDDNDSIFESDIDRLGTAGVTKGCNPSEGNTKFCPTDYVTRGQMAAFLHRALG